ncbi:hypothetical protein PYCC9005_003790 [Savitreella phatthalungensis]
MDEEALLAEQRAFYASGTRPAAKVTRKATQDTQSGEGTWGDIPGDRVQLNLDEPTSIGKSAFEPFKQNGKTTALVGNVLERDSDDDDDSEPVFKQPANRGAPTVTKLDWRARKQSKLAAVKAVQTEQPVRGDRSDLKDEIDKENRAKLAQMSEAEIKQEREELMSTLSPELQRLLLAKVKRAGCQPVTDASNDDDLGESYEERHVKMPEIKRKDGMQPRPTAQNDAQSSSPALSTMEQSTPLTPAATAAEPSHEHVHSVDCVDEDGGDSVHFPRPKQPQLDPSSETFLQDLHEKYFPDLESDPKAMAWMQAPSDAEDKAVYHPSLSEVDPIELRFDFAGKLLGPATSREVDSRLGLHHHADAPTAAGYTVPELAHLARSAMPAQACLAIQTAGRVMYRAARDGFGPEISRAVRNTIEKVQLEQVLLARTNDRHLGVRSLTTEALWLAHQSAENTVRQFEV